jgi:hypothetical protein
MVDTILNKSLDNYNYEERKELVFFIDQTPE